MDGAGWAWVAPNNIGADSLPQGWLTMRPALPPEGMDAFAEQVSLSTTSRFNLNNHENSTDIAHSVALYNAVMLYAHAATKLLANGTDKLHNGHAVAQAVRQTNFRGVGDGLVT